MQQEEHSLSEDKPPSYIDLHSHSFMSGDGVLRVQNLFPDVSGESRLPDYFSIGIHPKNIDPKDDFFDKLYRDYHIRRVEARRSINSKGCARGPVREILVSNFIPREQ